MDLKLRPRVVAGDKLENDYQVIWEGISIARILKQPRAPVGRPNRSWGVIFPHLPQQQWHRGLESDLEESKRRFRVAWTDMWAKLTEAVIEAARHQIEDNKRRPWNR
jgi:hypothetical protein